MRILRIVIGYALACIVAAATLVLFVYTPAELATMPARFSEAAWFSLFVAPYLALFAAVPALVGIVLGELRGIATWGYHAVVGLIIAALGFLSQHFMEAPGEASILHNYALTAFLAAGLVGGLAYWLISGRFASRHHADVTNAPAPLQARPTPGA
jgi:hypothetical protein